MATSKTLTEERYRKLLENINDSVTVVDASGKTIWTSATARRDLGYGAQFWQSENLMNLVHPDDAAAITGSFDQILAHPHAATKGEVRLRQPDGSYTHVGFTAVNLLDDIDIEGIVITAHSIEAELRERESQAAYEEELRVAAADQSRFLSNISHEMRSPLHAILGLSEVLAKTPNLPPESVRHIESIVNSSSALRLMIDDLLDFSKMSAGHMELVTEPFSPGAVADDVLESLRLNAQSKGLTYSGNIDPAVPRVVLGDRHKLRQLLVNLLSNAVKYTAVGAVTLAVEVNGDGSIRFSVSDTGPGIAEQALPTLFDPYKQARKADSNKGTGLGLTISKQLAELMGGTLELETGDAGTTFWCDLVFAPARRASDQIVESRAEPSATGRILVVDDSPVNLMLSTAQLERLGYCAITCDSGFDALDLLAERAGGDEPIDLVLMDWHMPEMDGLETTAKIRQMERSSGPQRTPIIAMTASALSGDRERCLDAGMDDYLAKPVSIDELKSKLDQWLSVADSTATEASASEPIGVEPNKIEQLVTDLGDKFVVAAVIGTFLTELPQWSAELTRSVDGLDYDRARRTAHTVKSSAALLGAAELARTCAAIEDAKTVDKSKMSALSQRFEHNVVQVSNELAVIKIRLESR